MPVPVIIITGFLGSGKTSLLRRLLPLCGEAGVRPALVINEVGKVDVDGELLADLHAEQVRLVGGCVCCTLQAQLTETIHDVLARQMGDLVLIECSGLSNPLDVLGALSVPALLREVAVSHIVCLLDAPRADKVLQVAEVAKAQIAAADLIVLNKADLLPEDGRHAVEALTSRLAPRAELAWTSFGDLGRERLLQLLTDPAPVRPAVPPGHHHDHGEHAHSLPASFCTAAFALPTGVSSAAMARLLAALPDSVIRAKGFAHLAGEGWHVLHRVYDTVDIIPLPGDPPRAGALLVCIGQHLQPKGLAALIEEML